MPSRPSVSIIIPCYNGAQFIPTLAESVNAQLSPDVEVVFVDDGSEDNSLELFSRLVPSATCIRQENSGLGATRNRAVQAARGEFLQLLDADDTVEPGKLKAQAEYALENSLDVVYSDWRMVIVDGETVTSEPFCNAESQREIVEALLGGWWFPPVAALVQTEAFRAVGGCDASLGNTCEDFDLWVRLGINGFSYGYLAGQYGNYHRYSQLKSMSRKNRREYLEGEEQIIRSAVSMLEESGGLTAARSKAAARRLHQVARSAFAIDPAWYEKIMDEAYRLDPGFRPPGSLLYRMVSRAVGMRTAERWALCKRRRQRPGQYAFEAESAR